MKARVRMVGRNPLVVEAVLALEALPVAVRVGHDVIEGEVMIDCVVGVLLAARGVWDIEKKTRFAFILQKQNLSQKLVEISVLRQV